MLDSEKGHDSRRWCCFSWRHCQFFILVMAVVGFVYVIDVWEMSPQMWVQNMAKQWGSVALISTTYSNTSELTTAADAAGFTIESTTPLEAVNASVEAEQTTPKYPLPATPVPYVSPGPYVVEYPYEYNFIIDEPKKCEQVKPFVVLMVPVAPHNRKHRDIIRSTWGAERRVLEKVVMLFFLLGRRTGEGTEQLQEQLLQESQEHQDLLQSDFLDCYKNLTIKTMVMMEWLDSRCTDASYAMKIDSDMFLNVPNLIRMLLQAPKANYLTGLVVGGALVRRDRPSKWYVPWDIYSGMFYPRYALGLGYVLTLDLPKKLVEASRHIRAIYIEDVFLGMCMEHLGIPLTDPPSSGYFNVSPVRYNRCAFSRLIATTINENADLISLWKDFKKPGTYC